MNQVSEFIMATWLSGRQTKRASSGWITANAPCCEQRGYSRDIRGRGGLIQDSKNTSYHCFNCGFKSSYDEGQLLSGSMINLLSWMGADFEDLGKIRLVARSLQTFEDQEEVVTKMPVFKNTYFPKTAMPLLKALETDARSHLVAEYLLIERGLEIDDYEWYWDSEKPNYLMIPFYYRSNLVGWTSRCIDGNGLRYVNNFPPSYVMNLDRQTYDRKYVIVVEGPLDAIAIDGVAIFGSDLKEGQYELIKQLNRQVVVVPDRDKNGNKLLTMAIKYGWQVSMPSTWYWDVKDTNDAVKKYGKIYTIHSILTNALSPNVARLASHEWFIF